MYWSLCSSYLTLREKYASISLYAEMEARVNDTRVENDVDIKQEWK